MGKLLKRTNDLVFKSIFGDVRHVNVLRGFLLQVLDLPESEYDKIEVVNPFEYPDIIDGKLGILDVKLHTKSSHVLDIEMQVGNMSDMRNRAVYYTSKMVAEQLIKGDEYRNLRRSISIVIAAQGKIVTDNERYINQYRFRTKTGDSEISDRAEINILELDKLPYQSDNTELWDWCRFLKTDSEGEIEMLAQSNVAIREAVGVLKHLSMDEKMRMMAESREKFWRDQRSREKTAREEGIAIGEKKGRKSEQVQIARKLIEIGLDVKQIEIATGLSIGEIEKLR